MSGENNVLGFTNQNDPYVTNSAAIGYGLIVMNSQHIAVGQYNTQYTTGVEPVFTVANGTSSSDRHDAFVVKKDSTTQINGPLVVTGTVATVNGSSVLTQSAANALYLPANAGLAASNGNIVISGSSSLTLPDGTVLSGSNTLKSVMTSGTDNQLPNQVLSSSSNSILTQKLADQRYIVNGDTGGRTASVTGGLSVTGSSTFSGNATVSGKITVNGSSGGIVVTGTMDSITNTVIASGTNQLVLIPQQGDLSMGDFKNGSLPQ